MYMYVMYMCIYMYTCIHLHIPQTHAKQWLLYIVHNKSVCDPRVQPCTAVSGLLAVIIVHVHVHKWLKCTSTCTYMCMYSACPGLGDEL